MAEAMQKAMVQFDCRGTATGKMRNELDVRMVLPFEEGPFELATDEGSFHGGDASAPPPLALFVGGLTGCIMTQIRAFAKRLGVTVADLKVDTRVQWNWEAKGRIYETAPHSFEIDVMIDSPDEEQKVVALIEAAKKGCFIEQTLGRQNTIRHRMKTADGWKEV
ncbi:OsmC family protein [Nitratireductor mangrovi]|uniref:OsmC family protein n=1 Tax=Nitratireductor mangrovi TaxID=2599600 RepID=A0A5B8KXK0_9HYPH|nr:OsmC family protein [Nitratireductor mangrovi]QDZ00321.1 OsmC family protein [Nitratireductor mangrovi]